MFRCYCVSVTECFGQNAQLDLLQYTWSYSNFLAAILEVTLAVIYMSGRRTHITFCLPKCVPDLHIKTWQLIFNENELIMQYWSVAVICQNNMSQAYWGQLRKYLGPVFLDLLSFCLFFPSLQMSYCLYVFLPNEHQTFCHGHWANNKSGFTRAYLQKW